MRFCAGEHGTDSKSCPPFLARRWDGPGGSRSPRTVGRPSQTFAAGRMNRLRNGDRGCGTGRSAGRSLRKGVSVFSCVEGKFVPPASRRVGPGFRWKKPIRVCGPRPSIRSGSVIAGGTSVPKHSMTVERTVSFGLLSFYPTDSSASVAGLRERTRVGAVFGGGVSTGFSCRGNGPHPVVGKMVR